MNIHSKSNGISSVFEIPCCRLKGWLWGILTYQCHWTKDHRCGLNHFELSTSVLQYQYSTSWLIWFSIATRAVKISGFKLIHKLTLTLMDGPSEGKIHILIYKVCKEYNSHVLVFYWCTHWFCSVLHIQKILIYKRRVKTMT